MEACSAGVVRKGPMRSSRSLKLPLIATPLALVFVLIVFLYAQVRTEAMLDESRPAQAIVVFGAAEYSGRPSPTLRSRLDQALTLYRRKLAPLIVTTGGPGGDSQFTEAEVARNYLVEHGVPAESILVEKESSTTDQSVVQVGELLARNRISMCIAVSDGYHLFRIKRQLAAGGVTAYGCPRASRYEPSAWTCLKQVFAYLLWKVGIRI
jgi:uncharacterized SAM-binding protein YcdF (DUF218 family)